MDSWNQMSAVQSGLVIIKKACLLILLLTSTVSYLGFSPEAHATEGDHIVTRCSYLFTDNATGWRTHTWQGSDCSNGLPQANSMVIGNAENGNGTGGQAYCSTAYGQHYNHPTNNGATTGLVSCLFVAPPASGTPTATVTKCSYTWPNAATG